MTGWQDVFDSFDDQGVDATAMSEEELVALFATMPDEEADRLLERLEAVQAMEVDRQAKVAGIVDALSTLGGVVLKFVRIG